jgi:hypothetical protein
MDRLPGDPDPLRQLRLGHPIHPEAVATHVIDYLARESHAQKVQHTLLHVKRAVLGRHAERSPRWPGTGKAGS